MALTLGYDSHSEIGLVRSTNQDSAYTSPRMLMVADGMGGAAAGDLASTVAITELKATDEELDARIAQARAEREASGDDTWTAHGTPPAGADVLTVMAGTLAAANDRLVDLVEDDEALAGMGTTVCGFVLSDDVLAVVNIGDSRAYLLRDGRLHRVTRDHSWVQTLVDEGRITEEEALEHPHRSLVLRVLNGAPQHEPDLDWMEIRPGDRLLVCSDGLCGLVTDAAIEPILGSGTRAEVISDLVALAHDAGGYDNITLIVADVTEDGPPGPVAVLGAAAATPIPQGPEHTLSFPPLAELDPDVAGERALTEEERYALLGRRRPSAWVKVVLWLLVPVLALGGGGFAWYGYTQTRYFVGASDEHVALFRGVPDPVFGLPLSTLVERDETLLADLPAHRASQVRANIVVPDLAAAQVTMDELAQMAARCLAAREAQAAATAPPVPPAEPPLPDGEPVGARGVQLTWPRSSSIAPAAWSPG